MDNLLAEFINETRDLVQQASQDFLKIEENPEDREIINSLFRAMHTIKGSSGVFELTPLTELVHEAENILDQAREGKLTLTPEIIDVFLDILDQINMWMDELEAEEKLGPDAEEYSKKLKDQLYEVTKDLVQNVEDIASDEDEKKKREVVEAPQIIEEVSKIPVKQRIDIIKSVEDWDKRLFFVVYKPDENCFFSGDDPILTVKKTPGLLGYYVETKNNWPEKTDEFDPFVCNLNFYLISEATKEELDEHFAYVVDQVEINQISLYNLLIPSGERLPNEQLLPFLEDVDRFLNKKDFSSILKSVQVAKEITAEESFQHSALKFLEVGLLKDPKLSTPWIKSLVEAIRSGEFRLPKEDEEGIEETFEETKSEEKGPEPELLDPVVLDLLKKQVELLTFRCPDDIKIGQLKSINNVIVSILSSLGFDDLKKVEDLLNGLIENFSFEKAEQVQEELSEILKEVTKIKGKKAEREEPTPIHRPESKPVKIKHPQIKTDIKVLKVDQEQIDTLMDLVSELVVAKNALPYLAKRAEEEFSSRELGRELKNQYATINRICEELQNVVMQIRMIPVSHVFQRFPRLVRDMARKLNKKVRLIIEGEETKADKNVIEKMADPLVHLIRNSIDHGIETPEERISLGKPEEGTVLLSATQLEDQVVIEVKDDGRGIDVEKVKRKAYEKGLIDEETLEKLSFQEALELIFAPGLSTAEEVSDISGRGVGMDAVRTMVEEVGGRVNIKTELGKGTTVSLSLPLSMAVTRILMIEVAGELFGVPIENVSETVKLPISEVHKVKDKEVIVLRDRIIPLYRLKDILKLESSKRKDKELRFYDEDEISVLIVALEKYEFGLVVDEFHEGIDIVLKPLEGIMSKFTLYSGATLLGDGRVLLVLNPKEIVKWL